MLTPIEPRADSSPAQATVRQRTRPIGARSVRHYLARGTAALVVLGCLSWLAIHAVVAWSAYRSSQAELAALRGAVPDQLTGLSGAQADAVATHARALETDLRRLDAAATLPAGGLVARMPWLGPRYVAAHQLLRIGQLVGSAGAVGAGSGADVLTSLQASGVSAGKGAGPSWLDSLVAHQAAIDQAATQLAQARALRAELDPAYLPAPARAQLGTLDRYLSRFDPGNLTAVDLPALRAGLGYDRDVRYAVVFQDPQELRPSGGFAGTLALVTISHGRIKDVSFSLSTPLSNAYNGRRGSVVPQPWPIETFFPQDGFQIQDALWSADFPQGAATYLRMYAETGWPPIDGVIAIQPAVVSDLLRLYGPIPIDVDGETRTVTADNLIAEIERQEVLRLQKQKVDATHKEVLMAVGEALVQRIMGTGAAQAPRTLATLLAAADRRDIQLYAADGSVEQALDQHGWSGRLVPRPGTPTVAVTLANVAINKTSLALSEAMALSVGPVVDGRQSATLTIDLTHTGDNQGDPLFTGFQKWYVEVALPEGSRLETSQPDALANPQAPNGGSYEIDLFAGQTSRITLQFTMPAASEVLFRRQPGLNPVRLTTSAAGQSQTQSVQKDVWMRTTAQP